MRNSSSAFTSNYNGNIVPIGGDGGMNSSLTGLTNTSIMNRSANVGIRDENNITNNNNSNNKNNET